MKMVKSLLLGTVAGLVAVAGAQAADLPVKAKPVQYVKICSLYGVGFYYIPGTDTCVKLGGWARYETGTGYNGSFTTEWFANNVNNRNTVNWHERVKGNITVDAREQTEYGTLRSYVDVGVSTNENGNGQGTLGGVNGSDGVANYANRWFIQWAGFTIGRSTSFYDFYSIGANQYGFAGASSDSGDGGWNVLGYTAQLGNGMSASIAVEEQRRTQIINAGGAAAVAFAVANTGAGYAAEQVPDVVGNLRVEQAWGSAQVMGAIHEVQANYYTAANQGSGHPGDETGFAVGAGIKLNAPMIGKGDYFQAEADYTNGASRYDNMTAAIWNYNKFNGNNIGFGFNTDAVMGGVVGATASGLELTTSWAVNAAFTHFWNPAWKTTLWGSYLAQSYNDRANAMLCVAGGGGNGLLGTAAVATAGCDMDWDTWGFGLRTEWAVNSNFQIGLEVLYAKLESAATPNGLINLAGVAASGIPAGAYAVNDQDQWAVRLRINRNFYP